uniref:Uncharacterized protein n=1 Tax=Meloidogyne floridensis TaxID=298350 RepID=A0A915NF78_9BILA
MLSNKISSDEFTSSSNSSENKHQTSDISNRKRLRRRGSVVQPLSNDSVEITKNIDINTISNSFLVRPHSLSARHIQKPIEQSQPNEWIYIQLPDRTFKRTTEKDLQNCQQALDKPTDNFDIKNYPSELSSVIFAKKLHSLFHSISTISQGFLAGIAFSHAIFIFLFLPELKGHENLVNIYSQMAVPIQAFFYICLSIAVVDALDG